MAHRDHIIIEPSAFREHEAHHFTVDASEIGLAPGEWPRTIEVKGTFGNGQVLEMVRFGQDSCAYRQTLGCVNLIVNND